MIPRNEYFEMLSRLAVPCVDNIAFRLVHGETEVLLLKRKEQPAKECLYPIGRRYEKNIFGTERALEVVKQETGLETELVRPFGFYDKKYAVGQTDEVRNGLHTPCLGVLVRFTGEGVMKIDSTSLGYCWIRKGDLEKIPLPPYTRLLLNDSEVFSRRISELGKFDGKIHFRKLDYGCYGSDFSQFALKD